MSGIFGSTTIKGTRITDFAQTSASVGDPIPFLYGRAPVTGKVIFAALPPKETRNVQRQGKGGVKQETFTYSTSYAIAFCRGPILGYWWIKRNGKVVYSQDPAAPIEDKDYAAKWAAKVMMYNGTMSQMPNSMIESYKGTGRVSAFRGLGYIAVPNEDVTSGGGAIPSYEAVPIASPAEVWITSKPYAQIARDSVNTSARLGSVTLYDWLRTAGSQESKTAASFVPGPGQLFEVAPPEHNDFAAAQFVPAGGELKPPPTGTFKDNAAPAFVPTNGSLAVPPLGTVEKNDVAPGFAPTGGTLSGGGGGDPYWANVIALLNFPGADGTTTFTDETGKVWTPYGNAQIDTSSGYNGGQFDGSGDYLTTPSSTDFDFGTGDFTIELVCKFAAASSVMTLVGNYTGASNGFSLQRRIDSATLRFGFGDSALIDRAWTPATGTAYHIAVCRGAGTIRLFVDGVQLGASAASATDITSGSATVTVACLRASSPIQYFNGLIRALRITKGAARYTADFTPPTAPFPNS